MIYHLSPLVYDWYTTGIRNLLMNECCDTYVWGNTQTQENIHTLV